MVQAKRPLLDQFRGLGVDQPDLPVQEPLGRAAHVRVILRVIGGEGCGIGVGADPPLAGAWLRSLVFAAGQSLQNPLGHDAPPGFGPLPRSALAARSRGMQDQFTFAPVQG